MTLNKGDNIVSLAPLAGELHGDMTQAARLESLENFRKGSAAFLLCTDVAARGLDIMGVQARGLWLFVFICFAGLLCPFAVSFCFS